MHDRTYTSYHTLIAADSRRYGSLSLLSWCLMPFTLRHPFRSGTERTHTYHFNRMILQLPMGKTARRVQGPVQVSAVAVRPWPWRTLSGDSTMSLTKEARQLLMPFNVHAPLHSSSRQKEASPVWHGIDLTEGSKPSATMAPANTVEAAATAFKVHTPELLQVRT